MLQTWIHVCLCMNLILPQILCHQAPKHDYLKRDKSATDFTQKINDLWQRYKARCNKTYTCREESKRRAAWESNLRTIYEHNLLAKACYHTYTLTDNCLADLTASEYQKTMIKLKPDKRQKMCDRPSPIVGTLQGGKKKFPSSFDWRSRGFQTPPIDQKDCGCCYALSLAFSIQGQVLAKYGKNVVLSSQQIVDCSRRFGNMGCTGGSLRRTLNYLKKTRGLMRDDAYPFTSQESKCRFRKDLSVVDISTWEVLPVEDELALEVAVVTIGPIAVSLNASPDTFQLYERGVYADVRCGNGSTTINHAMLIVGFTPEFWILKNWWGSGWGENGYMRLSRKNNLCGVTQFAAYAVIS